MKSWRKTILIAGSRDDTIIERRRFNHALTLLRAGARLQCMCMTAKGLQCKNKAREGGIFCGRHTACKVSVDTDAKPKKEKQVAKIKQCTRRKGRCQVLRKGEAAEETCEFNTSTGRCRNRKFATNEKKKASVDLLPYIKSWISIENIACRLTTMYLSRMENNMEDECSRHNYFNCTRNGFWTDDEQYINCDVYFSESQNRKTCVDPRRIQHFAKGKSIVGKFNEPFHISDVIEVNPPFIEFNPITGELERVKVFLIENKQDLYMMFNCGRNYDPSNLWETDGFMNQKIEGGKSFMDTLCDLVEQQPYHKFILCGHSMGCVSALRVGYELFSRNRTLFNTKCIVTGSGPFPIFPLSLDNTHYRSSINNFKNLSNVRIFSTAEGSQLDYMLFKNASEQRFSHYYPIHVLPTHFLPTTEKGSLKVIDDLDEYKESYPMSRLLHDWSNSYFAALKKYIGIK